VRGVSALATLLAERPNQPLLLQVVWEPVVMSDRGPPSAQLAAVVADDRARKYWDGERRLSAAMRAHPSAPAACLGDIVWDAVFVFAPGARWTDAPPPPLDCGRTVVRALPQVASQLR
jgi:hypothetical protein